MLHGHRMVKRLRLDAVTVLFGYGMQKQANYSAHLKDTIQLTLLHGHLMDRRLR